MSSGSAAIQSSDSGPVAFTPAGDCSDQCILNAATTAVEAAPLKTLAPTAVGTVTGASSNPSPGWIVFFTAYSITSRWNSKGFCITSSGTSIQLLPELSIIKPTATDPAAFGSSATSLFGSYLGFSSCSGNQLPVEIIASDLVQVINVTSVPPPTLGATLLTSTTSPSPDSNSSSRSPTISSTAENTSSDLTPREKAAVGVVVPVVAIISFALGMIFYLRRLRRRSQSGKGKNVSEETQPYLQQKAELEAEEKRRLELEAVEVRYEMDGETSRKAMPAPGNDVRNEIDTVTRPPMPSLRERQELRGEEFSRELEAP